MSTVEPIRVMCVDDNPLIAEAIERRIQQETDLAWAGTLADDNGLLAHIVEFKPDVILMDIDIPGVNTFGLVEMLAEKAPQVRVVMFSGHLHPKYLDRALDSGAWGYLSKSEDSELLIEGIMRVGRGEFAFSKEVEAMQRRMTS